MKKLFFNGKLYIDRGRFCEAALVEDGRILAVGKNKDFSAASDVLERVDLQRSVVLPGLNDSHCHFSWTGAKRYQADLSKARSIQELIVRCRRYLEEYPGRCKDVLRGMGWNEALFEEEARMPTRQDLDRITDHIPVVLRRSCGHVCTVNTRAMRQYGLSPELYPKGILKDRDVVRLEKLLPPVSLDEKEAYFIEAQKHALSLGLTSIQSNDIGALDDYWTYDLLAALYRTGIGKIRFRHQICPTCLSDVDHILEEAQRPIYRKGALRMGPIKLFKDGGIGARTAMLRKGYTDDPGNKGSSFLSLDEQVMYYKKAQASGVQILTHVIGDGAIEETLDAYTQVEGASGNPLRHGLIHCQVTDQPLLKRISAENMAVFFQPGHRSVVLPQMVERCGPELTATSFAWNTLKQMGCHCSYGTDAPVIDLDPFPSIQAALTDGNGCSSPSERVLAGDWVDLSTAIDAYTLESAYCEGMEKEKGRLQPGYLADFTVIDRDIFEIGLDSIAQTRVRMTVIGGDVVWDEVAADSKRAPKRGADNRGALL